MSRSPHQRAVDDWKRRASFRFAPRQTQPRILCEGASRDPRGADSIIPSATGADASKTLVTMEISERSFEEAIECALLQHGPDACAGGPTGVL
jgi:hypothetical protein